MSRECHWSLVNRNRGPQCRVANASSTTTEGSPSDANPFSRHGPLARASGSVAHVHNRLIVSIADELVPKVAPRYFVGLEQHTYLCRPGGTVLVGEPDIGISRTPGIATAPGLRGSLSTAGVGVLELDVEVPVKDSVEEWYLEIHETATGKVVTVLEVLCRRTSRARTGGSST